MYLIVLNFRGRRFRKVSREFIFANYQLWVKSFIGSGDLFQELVSAVD